MQLFKISRLSGLLLVLATFATACTNVSAEIVGSSSDRVWIKKPLISDGGAEGLALEHCAKTDRLAVFESEMSISDGKRIDIYMCQ